MEVLYPSISADGKMVAFATRSQELYVINMDGKSQREISRQAGNVPVPAWSPDGNSLVFDGDIDEHHEDERNSRQLTTIDMQSGKRSVIASSQGIVGASWIASDTLIAGTEDSTKLVMFDINTGKVTELVSGAIIDWATSPDRKYLYYATTGAEPKAILSNSDLSCA